MNSTARRRIGDAGRRAGSKGWAVINSEASACVVLGEGRRAAARDAIFIVSPLNRSGTNYLADILCTIPGFEIPRIKEDYVLEHAALLEQYARLTERRWGALGQAAIPTALRCLGDGILHYLREACEQTDTRMVNKTPRAYGIRHFFQLFPQSRLLLLVRDGRDVVESAARSFTYKSHVQWMKEWRTGARLTIDFMQSDLARKHASQWRLVKYEDLVERPRETLPGILEFLQISPESFDWDRFDSLPLRGSSSSFGAKEEVNWTPIEKPKDFRPVGRWSEWSAWRLWRFRQIAGREMRELGFEL